MFTIYSWYIITIPDISGELIYHMHQLEDSVCAASYINPASLTGKLELEMELLQIWATDQILFPRFSNLRWSTPEMPQSWSLMVTFYFK